MAHFFFSQDVHETKDLPPGRLKGGTLPDYYEVIEHTADIRIRVRGRSLPELFCNAARALFDIIAEPSGESASANRIFKVRVEAQSRDELLVNWLNELLFLSATHERIFTDFHIHEIDDHALSATVTGGPFTSFRLKTEVKAATYHGLAIEELPGAFKAEIVFDV